GRRDGERRTDGRCAFDEQLHCIVLQQRLDGGPVRHLRKRERGNAPHGFAGNAESFAARGEDARVLGGTQDRVGEVRAGGDEVLAVVQDQQELSIARVFQKRIENWPVWSFVDVEYGGNSLRDEARIGQRGQINNPDAIG